MIKNQLKSSIDKPGVERCQGRCRDCLKIVFQEGKNTDMNAIKLANTTKDPNSILNSQNHLSTKKNFKHIDPENTHIQTKQV